MKVLFITNIPAPYRMRFFNSLGRSVNLRVIYEAEYAKNIKFSFDSVKSLNHDQIFLKRGVIREKIPNFRILKYLIKHDFDILVLTNYAYATELIGFVYARLKKINYVIEEDGNRIKENEPKLIYFIKKWLISGASYYLSPSKNTDIFFEHYGADPSKITRYPFTSVSMDDIPTDYYQKKKTNEKIVFLYVGRIIHLKGVDVLVNAFNKATESISNIELKIIGDSPDAEYLKKITESIKSDIKIIDFMQTKELKLEYAKADVFVFPTRYDPWGLVINEAISMGLPIISSNNSKAAQELILHGTNGLLYEPEDVSELSKHILTLAMDSSIRSDMSNYNTEIAPNHTIEKMVEVHVDFFNKVIKNE
jgi:glycosyltransferase involved in cell wall biosynthesis